MFEDAIADELLDTNPCALKRGELPKKIDKDPMWRPGAVFTKHEVEAAISDERIPIDRRVYALAAWKLRGWASVMGRTPTDDDLLIPSRSGKNRSVALGVCSSTRRRYCAAHGHAYTPSDRFRSPRLAGPGRRGVFVRKQQ